LLAATEDHQVSFEGLEKAGTPAEVIFKFKVKDGFHVQANPSSENLIATTLNLDSGKTYETGKPVYPPGQVHELKALHTKILTYSGNFQVRVPLLIKAKGEILFKGHLRYQACNKDTCYLPKKLPFEVKRN